MAFVELREEGNWTIQGVVTATSEPPEQESPIVSRPMVRWIAGTNPESFVVVEAEVQRPIEPVKRCRVSNFELRITRCYLLAPAPAILGMTLAAANRPVVDFNDEAIGPPAASMLVHLDNIAMHKRGPVQQAVADIRMEMKHLFRSYLKARGFKEFEPPSLIGAAFEGGSSVFRMPYFAQEAFLAQSPQFYKQFEIAEGRKRVFSIAPVFRAENSNTPRHMTEFTGLDLEMEIRNDYSEVLYLLEGVLLYIFRQIHRIFKDEIEPVRSVYPSSKILLPAPGQEVRLTFTQAQQLLREEGPAEFRHVRDDEDMSTPQEKALGALVR
ncbi:Putative Aspartyl-tRNA synthetase [Podospora comata]|uniref:aspartate--tRNA ligase n=1 Tax=Podospora comata TaxID=48703 RepID=A0ABY6SAP7_PODCO|nr:Putative Aspartyl-tRNA synthetase [Podospora comata]